MAVIAIDIFYLRKYFTSKCYASSHSKSDQLWGQLNHISLSLLSVVIHTYIWVISLYYCLYLWVSPKARSSTVTVYGPAKSWMTPSLIEIPVCPMKGRIQVIRGRGVHTIQKGNLAFYGSILAVYYWSLVFVDGTWKSSL